MSKLMQALKKAVFSARYQLSLNSTKHEINKLTVHDLVLLAM